jgi:hypothetical protein
MHIGCITNNSKKKYKLKSPQKKLVINYKSNTSNLWNFQKPSEIYKLKVDVLQVIDQVNEAKFENTSC